MKHSVLEVYRKIIPSQESRRFTGQVHNLASQAFGHDNAALVNDGVERRAAGNPLYRVFDPLRTILYYREAVKTPRNKTSSFELATKRVEDSKQYKRGLADLRRRHDGLDFDRMPVIFGGLALVTVPFDAEGRQWLGLVPSIGQREASLLAEEAALHARCYSEQADRVGSPESPITPMVPLLEIEASVAFEGLARFEDLLGENNTMPITLTLGALDIYDTDTDSSLNRNR